MKLVSPSRSRAGSALLVTLVSAGVIGITLTSYLSMTSNQNQAVTRSQTWNSAMPVVEAGVEEALTYIYYCGQTNLVATNGWTLSNGAYRKSRSINGGRYEVAVSNVSPPYIYSVGYVVKPLSTNEMSRTVRIKTTGGFLFAKGLVAKGLISIQNGNVDSFDSYGISNYVAAIRQANGDVTSINNNITVGSNGEILGHASVGGAASINNSGYIGLVGGSSGTASGYATFTATGSIPDTVLPSNVGPNKGTMVDLSGNGTYTFSGSIASGIYYTTGAVGKNVVVTGGAQVILYTAGDIVYNGNSTVGMQISTNSSLTIYAAGNLNIGGGGIMNSGNALNCAVYGLSTCTSINLHGNGAYTGVVYAPYAALEINGGGNAGAFVGAAIVASASFTGNGADFHYDENLGRNGPSAAVRIASWDEL